MAQIARSLGNERLDQASFKVDARVS